MLKRASILRFISSFLLLGGTLVAYAQDSLTVSIDSLAVPMDTMATLVASSDSVPIPKKEVAPVQKEPLKKAKTTQVKIEKQKVKKPKKESTVPVYQGTYIGIDIWNPLATAWNDGKFEISVAADVGLWHRLFPRFEIGMMAVHQKPEDFEYQSTGMFMKLGANYNFVNFKNNRRYDHSFFAGVHYAYSYTGYQLKNAIIEDPYWGESGSFDGTQNDCHFGWVEFQIGVRVQIYRGFFMGAAMHLKTFGHYYQAKADHPAYIPGFGVDYGTTNIGFQYTLTYQFPSKARPRPAKKHKVKTEKEKGFF